MARRPDRRIPGERPARDVPVPRPDGPRDSPSTVQGTRPRGRQLWRDVVALALVATIMIMALEWLAAEVLPGELRLLLGVASAAVALRLTRGRYGTAPSPPRG